MSIKQQTILQQLDELQMEQFPLVKHKVAGLSLSERLEYAQILALLLSMSNINDQQQRLWQLLLQACDLSDHQASLLSDTNDIDKEQWREILNLCERNSLQYVLILDILVLCCINNINQSQIDILVELISLLKVTEVDILDLIHCCDLILGNNTEYDNLTLNFDYDSIQHWHEFCYQKLDAVSLLAGIEGGRWVLSDNVQINDSEIQIVNAIICGGVGKKLKSINSNIAINDSYLSMHFEFIDCTTSLENSQFHQKSYSFKGKKSSLDIVKCVFNDQYQETDNGIYLIIENVATNIDGCVFEIEGARALNIDILENQVVNIKNSQFINCGDKNSVGGAISFVSNGHLLIEKVEFENCLAKKGGAIYIRDSYEGIKISECVFNNCGIGEELDNWADYARTGGAIYIEIIRQFLTVSNNTFIQSPLNLGNDGYAFKNIQVDNCCFKYSPIMYWYQCRIKHEKCAFENGENANLIVNKGA